MNTLVVMFAKYPQAGKVKTRLAKNIGSEAAKNIYVTFLKQLIHTHNNATEYTFTVSLSPEDKRSLFESEYSCQTVSQPGEELGEKQNLTLKSHTAQYEQVIIIGSDLPTLSQQDITSTQLALQKTDLVIGPAKDGGYYLIGAKNDKLNFENIRWSTEHTLEDLLRNPKKQHITYTFLEEKEDIDDVASLQRLNKEK
ncbi:MAG: rSAM/selenodomain-associated transferase 1 [Candidatus Woesearchaeota archaeon]|jgi:rSAM/selenodomain-associated transferase 1